MRYTTALPLGCRHCSLAVHNQVGGTRALQLCLPAAARPLCTSASTQTMPCLPLPRSVAKNQGIRFVFQDGSRIIFRLRCAPHGTAESCPSALLPWVLESRA